MIFGNTIQYGGWTVIGRNLAGYVPPRQACFIRMRHEDGRIIEGKTGKGLAREHGLGPIGQAITDIISGRRANGVKGWMVLHARFEFDYYPPFHCEPAVAA